MWGRPPLPLSVSTPLSQCIPCPLSKLSPFLSYGLEWILLLVGWFGLATMFALGGLSFATSRDGASFIHTVLDVVFSTSSDKHMPRTVVLPLGLAVEPYLSCDQGFSTFSDAGASSSHLPFVLLHFTTSPSHHHEHPVGKPLIYPTAAPGCRFLGRSRHSTIRPTDHLHRHRHV
jgi:hypothetical protein